MSEIVCLRCKDQKPAMEKAPMPTAIGQKIKNDICQDCFNEWKNMELKIINEYRLNMMEKEHRQFLLSQMKGFLGYETDGAALATVPE